VLAGLGGGNRLLGVQVDGRRDVDGVDPGIGDEAAPVWMRSMRADLARERFGEIDLCPADRDELAAASVTQCAGDTFANDIAGADETPT